MDKRKHIRLLFINGQDYCCQLLKEHIALNDYCYDVDFQCVSDTETAIQEIIKWTPNVVMLDIFNTDRNSTNILQYCHAADTPVLVTADESLPYIRQEVLDNGAAGFFKIDSDPDNLDYLLGNIVKLADEHTNCFYC